MTVETKAQLRSLRMSPQKVRLVADLVRGMRVSDALVQLKFSPKRAAKPLCKLLESAIANASHNHQLDTSSLVISTIFVNEGSMLKRWMPRAMGRATPLRKRSSHITLVLVGTRADESASTSPISEVDTATKKVDMEKDVEKKVEGSEDVTTKVTSTKKKTVTKKKTA